MTNYDVIEATTRTKLVKRVKEQEAQGRVTQGGVCVVYDPESRTLNNLLFFQAMVDGE